MATLLSKIFPNDVANYIYKIAIVEFIEQNIMIYTYNIYLIIEKHSKMNIFFGFDLLMLLTRDINMVINTLNMINNKYIIPYKKFEVDYSLDFKKNITIWINHLTKIYDDYLLYDNRLINNPHFINLRKKILLLNKI